MGDREIGDGIRGSGDIEIGFKPDPTETAALIFLGYIGYMAANITRIGFKPDPNITRSPISVPTPASPPKSRSRILFIL